MTENLISLLMSLIELTEQRNSRQGVESYGRFIEKLKLAKTPEEVLSIANDLKKTIQGIDAHGIYFPEEWAVAKKLLEQCELATKIGF